MLLYAMYPDPHVSFTRVPWILRQYIILNISNTLDEMTLHCKTNNTLRVLHVEWKERCSNIFLSHYLEQREPDIPK